MSFFDDPLYYIALTAVALSLAELLWEASDASVQMRRATRIIRVIGATLLILLILFAIAIHSGTIPSG